MYKLPTLQQLLEAGVHFGHQVRRGHPRMKPYIYGAREGVHIIDLEKSDKTLKEACEFVHNLGQTGKVLLFVGTKKQARPIIEEAAKRLNAPYLIQRWIGGFLTNFDQIQKNVKTLKDYKAKKEKGELSQYTKKEQLLIDRKVAKLEKDLGGVVDMPVLPDALFVVDAASDEIAVREANRAGVKVVAIADSNCDPTKIDYPIAGNDDAIKSIKILVEAVASAYEEGKKEAGKVAAKLAKKEEDDAKKAAEKVVYDEKLAEEVAAAEEKVEKASVEESERKVT